MKKSVLIVIDCQKDFIDGSLGTPEAKAIIPRVIQEVESTYDKDMEVYFTMDTHDEHYLETREGILLPVEHCFSHSEGWALPIDLAKALKKARATMVQKSNFGYLDWGGDLMGYQEVGDITLVGLCTDICVISNALILRAAYPNAAIMVIADACAGTTPEAHKMALEIMRHNHIIVLEDAQKAF